MSDIDPVIEATEAAIIRLMQGDPKAPDIKVAVDYLRLKHEQAGPPRLGSKLDGGKDDA